MADRWRTRPDREDDVKVTRPDPETGEVIEMTRRPATLKAIARKARREGESPNLLQITADERRKLIDGKIDQLVRKQRLADVEKGYVYVVEWDRPKPFADRDDGTVFQPEAKPACWVEVKSIGLKAGEGYAYALRVSHQGKTDQALRLKRAAGYTTDREQAIDEVEAELSPADRAKWQAQARQLAADQREQDVSLRKEAAKRQEATVRETLREAQAKLSPLAYQTLLAAFEAQIKQAIADERRAA